MDRIELGRDVEVELDIFSGRPNPRWSFADSLARELEEDLAAAEPGESRQPPGLGYRGFVLTAADGARVRAFDGVIAVERDGRPSYFQDRAGLEQRLLAYAREQGFGEVLAAFGAPHGESPASGD